MIEVKVAQHQVVDLLVIPVKVRGDHVHPPEADSLVAEIEMPVPGRDVLPVRAGGAGSHQPITRLFGLEPVAAVGDEAGAGGAEGVAQRRRAAPRIQPLAIDRSDCPIPAQSLAAELLIVKDLEDRQHLGGKRFVELDPDTPNRADVEASIALLEAKLEKAKLEAERMAAEARRKEELRRLEALGKSDAPPILPTALDASTSVEPPKKKSVATRWWFWTVVGVAVVAGGGVGTYFLVTSSGPGFDDIVDHR